MISGQADKPDELHGAVDRLTLEFAEVFSRESIDSCVHDNLARLGPTRVRTYRALFAYRFARERLLASAVASGALPRTVPEVLLVCTHDAGRSQRAAALLDHEAKGRLVVRLAGTDPGPDLHPGVRESLAELGIDASEAFPKPLPTRSYRPRTWSPRWAAATPARCCPVAATPTGSCRTPRARRPRRCAPSART